MNHDPNDIRNGELDQARLTAYALEQLEGAERAAVEALLAGSDRSRHTVEEIRALAAQVKQAAGGEPLPQQSSELRVVLEQYLPSEEAAEMNAKPEPSSEKAPRRGRRRSTLIWAAAVCALLAAIPGYMLVSGSLRPALRNVAVREPSPEASADANLTADFDKLVHDESEAMQFASSPADGSSLGVIPAKQQQPPGSGPVVASDKKVRLAPARIVDGRPSKRAPAAVPAQPKREGLSREVSIGRSAGRLQAQAAAKAPVPPPSSRESRIAGPGAPPKDALSSSMGVQVKTPPTAGQNARPMYSASKSKAPAPTSGGGASMGGMGGGMMRERDASSAYRPADVALQTREQLSIAPQRPVEVETLPDLDVVILKGRAKDIKSVRRWNAEVDMGTRRPLMLGAGRQYNRLPLDTEQYDPIVENPFLSAADNPESTFSIDVDTASYANVRRFLDSGRLPPPNAVRIEELVNYFRYDYPQPDEEVPFSVNMETAQCPWETEHRLVRIGLKGREIDPEQRGPGNLVFLLDVSGSMRDENKLPLVQYAMNQLVDQLTEDDRVAIVTYAGEAGVALESTSGDKHKKIRRAVDNLSAGGSTHGSAGIVMAYDQAMEHFVEGGTNRVILCTDGDLNVGITDDGELTKLITEQAKSGVFLTVLGFGTGNLKDSKMEKLADKGNGIYAYIDGRREARRVLVEQMAGSLVTIAKDVKLQIEFNPAEVARYRLIGYENRIMAAEDFANDKKDAGEIGAGHTVTALYEIVPGGTDSGGALGRELKYQRKTGRELTEAAASGELLTLKLRYKEPEGKKSKLLELVQEGSDKPFGQASADFRFAAGVAAFGMLLRGSQHAGDINWSAVEELAAGSLGEDPGGYRNEFLELIHRAGELKAE